VHTGALVEAFAEYLTASREIDPDLTIQVLIDEKIVKEVHVSKDNSSPLTTH